MGKLQTILKQLIKEEIDIFLKEEQDNTDIDAIVDYLLDFEDESINENIPKKPIMKVKPNPTGPQQTMKRPIVRQQPNPTIKESEDLEEAQGRTAGFQRKYRLKGGQKVEDVKRFLKLVQTKMKNKGGRGRKPNVFTDEDVEAFATLLTKPEGFDRRDILDTVSFYKGKPFQAAQKMMDVLGDEKLTGDLDVKGNQISIGKGYIETIDRPAKEKEPKKKEYDIEDDLDVSDPEEDFDEFDGNLSDLDSRDNYLNEMKILQKRSGLISELKINRPQRGGQEWERAKQYLENLFDIYASGFHGDNFPTEPIIWDKLEYGNPEYYPDAPEFLYALDQLKIGPIEIMARGDEDTDYEPYQVEFKAKGDDILMYIKDPNPLNEMKILQKRAGLLNG